MRTLLLAVVSLFAFNAVAADPVTFKIGTAVPRESPWGVVLRAWGKAVKEKTNGEVALEFFWNGTQGDEAAQMAKLKVGQLDGAVVTAVGLGVIDPNVNILQLPGLFANWEQLDQARDAMTPVFEKKFQESKLALVGWGDVGLDRLMSNGYAVQKPSDLKGKRAWVWREDPVLPTLFQQGESVSVPTSLPEVIPELSTGNVTVLSVSAIAAEQLQWASRLDHVTQFIVAPNIGGLVLSQTKLDSLSPANKQVMLDTGKNAGKALTDRIRGEDAKAFERLSAKMTVVKASDEDLKAWKAFFAATRARLAKGTFDAKLIGQAEQFAK
ncbi:MAG: TRAP transporter substrate-binding protein DctP [Myxococcaceae bacterium]